MLLSLQIPIADSRIFLNREETGILTKPSWDKPDENEFVRFFGQIRPRKSSLKRRIHSINDCAAKRAVRFTGSPIFISGNFKIDLRIQRHFTFDSLLVGQFEVSATNVLPESGDQLRLTEDKVDKLVRHFLDLKVNVLNPKYTNIEDSNSFIECKLHQLSRYLPKAYCKASTIFSKYNDIQTWWVQGGRPCLFLEIKGNENIDLPNGWKEVIWQSGFMKKFEFYKAHITGYDQTIPILISKGVSAKDYKVARDVRCCALNLLAENECVSIFQNNANKNYIDIDQVKQRLDEYKEKKKYLNALFYKCVIDETRDLFLEKFGRATLFRLRESRGDVSDKINILLGELTPEQLEKFLKKIESISSEIVKIKENFIKIFLP